MKTLIAIGGGSFQQGETRDIDVYAIQRTKKEHPRVLFFPTASHDDQGYAKRFKQYYRSLGCTVDALRLYHTSLTKFQIQELLFTYDMLYIGGGSTKNLLMKLQDMELEESFVRAYEAGIVCCGYSAGANLFFTYGYSDLYDNGSHYELLKGFDIVAGAFCPHAQKEDRKTFYEVIKNKEIKGFACDDGDAYILADEEGFFFRG